MSFNNILPASLFIDSLRCMSCGTTVPNEGDVCPVCGLDNLTGEPAHDDEGTDDDA